MKEKEIIFSFLSEKEISELDAIEFIYNLLSSTVSGIKQYHHKANPSIIYSKEWEAIKNMEQRQRGTYIISIYMSF